jgi:hypothetical protein
MVGSQPGPGLDEPRTEGAWLVKRDGQVALAVPPGLAQPLALVVRREIERQRRVNAGAIPDGRRLLCLLLDLEQVARSEWPERSAHR